MCSWVEEKETNKKTHGARKWIQQTDSTITFIPGAKKWDEGKDKMEERLEININDNMVTISHMLCSRLLLFLVLGNWLLWWQMRVSIGWMKTEIMVTKERLWSRNQAGPGRGLWQGNEKGRHAEFQGMVWDIKKYSRWGPTWDLHVSRIKQWLSY